ncbi:hypothetical protein T07_15104 [Trichinella nelsoni]|uniref:Uncharacterized protein n=1 Tax=Trichinella nelsoni TaxID=6336 RepID=A0A0V0RQ39_9BILA|nr:hypothetical protein T07_15104 [Trichinella nelsoni]
MIHICRSSLGFAALYFGCNSQLTIGVRTECLLGVLILLFSAAFRLIQRADFAISAGSR